MEQVSIDAIVEKTGSKYLAARILAQRARQLEKATRPELQLTRRKALTVALDELLNDQLEWELSDEPEEELFARPEERARVVFDPDAA